MNYKEFLQISKYSNWYCNIIDNASKQNRSKKQGVYYEKHHILPKSIWPKYKNLKQNPWNSVLLTAKEHFICHHLLMKIIPGNSTSFAFWKMHMVHPGGNKRYFTSRSYEYIKSEISKISQQNWKENNPNKSKWMKGKGNPMYGTSRKGKENPFYGKNHSDETKIKIGQKNKNTIWSDDSKQLLKNKWKERPILTCPYCNLQAKGPNMKRYHFDNCKSK